MKQKPRRILLRKLLLRRQGNKRMWPALIALCMGTVLMLYAIILWTGFRDVLAGKYKNESIDGTYLSISKEIPQQEKLTEQKPALFTNSEIRALSGLPGVQDIGMFTPGLFPVEVSFTGKDSKFSTSLFIEAVPDRFIDNKPIDWYWQYNSTEVPVIVSTEFMNLYNYGYAPNQGVPQLTKGTIRALVFNLKVDTGVYAEEFNARVVGFSDRISSILVPESFISFGNRYYSAAKKIQPSRLIVRVQDPSDELFVQYLEERKYVTNNELLRWNRMRTVVYTATAGMGLLAVILLVMGVMVFLVFAELAIANAKQNLQLLVQIGYSPRFLSRFMFVRYFFILLAVMLVAGVAVIIAQVRTAKAILPLNMHIATFPTWEVWAALVLIFVVLLVLVRTVIVRGVKN